MPKFRSPRICLAWRRGKPLRPLLGNGSAALRAIQCGKPSRLLVLQRCVVSSTRLLAACRDNGQNERRRRRAGRQSIRVGSLLASLVSSASHGSLRSSNNTRSLDYVRNDSGCCCARFVIRHVDQCSQLVEQQTGRSSLHQGSKRFRPFLGDVTGTTRALCASIKLVRSLAGYTALSDALLLT